MAEPFPLAERRAALGLSQSGLAAATGIPVNTIRSIEQGKAPKSSLWGPLDKLLTYIERHGVLGGQP